MSDFICDESHNWSCILNQTSGPPPTPLYGSPAFYLVLLAPPVAALLAQPVADVIFWFWRNLRPLGELGFHHGADQIPAVAAPRLPLEQPQPQQQQIPAIAAPQLPLEQPRPRRIRSILDANQVKAATDAISVSIKDKIKPINPALRPPQADSSDSDGNCSGTSDDETIPKDEYFQYPSVKKLEAGDVRLIVSNSMEQLQEMLLGTPEADRVETLRRAFTEADGLCRLSDVLENPWILYAEAFADPSELNKESTRNWVMKFKITTTLLCLIRRELDGQNWQLCQELKEECFAEVAGQSVEKLLEVARSFTDARWSAGHILQMLPMFDALVDVLSNIRCLTCSRSESSPNEVAGIFCDMVNSFRQILQTTNDMRGSKESTIHPATVFLIQALEFFYRNRDMLQSIFAPGDYTTDLHSGVIDCWFSKLKKDAERIFRAEKDQQYIFLLNKRIFRAEKDRQYIFLLNNIYCVWQMKCRPGPGGFLSNVVDKFHLLIESYTKSYLDEYWAPILSYLEGDSLNNPRHSSFHRFTEKFFSICDRQMKWKVRTELKNRLRANIKDLIVPPYGTFSRALQANPSSGRFSLFKQEKIKGFPLLKGVMQGIRKKKHENYTVKQLEDVIRGLFER